jgi:lipoic acid synthetase
MFDYQKSRDNIAQKRANLAKNSPRLDSIERKPAWLKVPLPSGENYGEIKENLRSKGLFTVCEEAKCPNISECWAAKTATVMILGGTCTRACKFCHVDTGNPKGIVNKDEIEKTAEMVGIMKLDYIVITSVDRDDLPDFGSSHFSAVVEKIHQLHPQTMVETLIPDFDADETHMHTLAKSSPLVIAQNMETVKRLTHVVRDKRAGYEKTLKALDFYKKNYPNIYTKTSLMMGLGETLEEITECLLDLRKIDVDIVTFGQYLRPTTRHLKVERYYTPEEFENLKTTALGMGFKFVASGPLVRSSYKASDFLKFLRKKWN